MCRPDQVQVAAHHEAGHAAWELANGRRVDRIRVDNQGGGSTRTLQPNVMRELCESEIDPITIQSRINDQVDNLLAGVVAECMYRGTDNEAGWLKATGPINLMSPCKGHDIADAAWLLHKLAGHVGKSHLCADCTTELRERLVHVAERLRDHRTQVESLAHAILTAPTGELHEDQIITAWKP